MTGYGVAGSNSLEFAPSSPTTVRANSTTATCIPRQIPRNGTPFSRANLAAAILPSIPRMPNPPGMRMPSACASRRTASSTESVSASTHTTSSRVPWWMAAWFSASTTER